ncbi:unnamed protein product [Brassica rapa subsp. narinosa]
MLDPIHFARTGSESLVIGSHQAGADLSCSQGVGDLSVHCDGERRSKVTRSGGEKHWPRDSVEGRGHWRVWRIHRNLNVKLCIWWFRGQARRRR